MINDAHCHFFSASFLERLTQGLPDLPVSGRAAAVASAFPQVPVIIPHFGAGMFREALMAADQCGYIHLDTSSSNGWMKYYPGLTLDAVFRQALAVAGAQRILFGTDSSFFPRGWQKGIYAVQTAALRAAGASEMDRQLILGGNFERLFPNHARR
jgi:predicted TIM-barrel fold metal-dependent hydrolase